MRFNVFFAVRGPGGQTEVANGTNPVEAPDLPALLREVARRLPAANDFGVQVVGLRVEQAPGGESDEFDPVTRENLTGRTEPCCECGGDYPRADLVVRGQIYCAKCRGGGTDSFVRASRVPPIVPRERLYHEFDSALTCDHCGVCAEETRPGELCPRRVKP